MTRTAPLGAAALVILAGLGVAGATTGAQAQEATQSRGVDTFDEMPAFWAVTGVRSDDVLHLRQGCGIGSSDAEPLSISLRYPQQQIA